MKKQVFSGLAVGMLLIASCNKSDNNPNPNPGGNKPAIELECNHFTKNSNVVLKNDPNAPVDYIVKCKMTIPDDVVIEEGTTIAFEDNAGFIVEDNASLIAIGSSTKPITFTGVKKAKGAWAGIIFFSANTKNELSNTIIEYAGGDHFNSNKDSGNVIIYSGSVKFNNNKITNSASYGVNLTNKSSSILNFENNTFENNLKPGFISIEKMHQVKSSNSFLNNTINKFQVSIIGNIENPTTWNKLSIPYFFTTGTCLIKDDLTIEPGTIIEMGSGSSIQVQSDGSLYAVGTASNRIVFRGEQSLAGYWENIYFNGTKRPLNQLNYVDIQHAGYDAPNSKGGVYLWASPKLSIDNTHFKDMPTCSIYGAKGALVQLTVGANVTHTNTGGSVCEDI